MYDNVIHYPKGKITGTCITCKLLCKPKSNLIDWRTDEERAITIFRLPTKYSFDEIVVISQDFAKTYMIDNQYSLTGVEVLFPNRMIKRKHF